MSFFYSLFNDNLITAAGWTIIHSIWQGIAIALAFSVILIFTGRKNNLLRYRLSIAAMILFALISILTFRLIYIPPEYDSKSLTAANETINQFTILSIDKDSGVFGEELIASVVDTVNNNIYLIFSLWAAGFLFFSLRLLGGLAYTQRYKKSGISPVSDNLQKAAERFSKKLNIKKTINVFYSTLVKSPVAIGYLKPIVLLPIGMISGIPINQIEAILAHELAHIKRADFLVNLIQSIIEVVFFYHPAVWWLSSVARTEREYLCDEITLNLCGDPETFANALISISDCKPAVPQMALPLINKRNQLLGRIKKMLGEKQQNQNTGRYVPAIILSVMLIFFVFFYFAKVKGISAGPNSAPLKVNAASLISMDELAAFFESTPDSASRDKSKTLSFYEDEDGEDVEYKVTFKDDEITSLYRDGVKIPYDKIEDYEDMIYDKIEELQGEYRRIKFDMHDFKMNMEEFRKNMQEFRDNFKNEKLHIDFDGEKLKEEMLKLREELRHLDHEKIKIDFDRDKFREEMKKLRHELRKMRVNWSEDFDSDFDIDIDIPEIDIDIPEIDIDIPCIPDIPDIPEINIDIPEINIDLPDMTELNESLKKLDDFMDELREELVKDGYIESTKEDFELEFGSDKMVVNGKRLPDDKLNKYKKIYKDIFGEDIEDECHIHTH